ncbi:putative f0-atpase subunit k protein [Erysiphe neolycopersici]|uniref:Putative f0-atpase subunit k protein n=1 Tax=Erysiphe neolycopersici TaxID=212602 RepID=A0A420HXQ2_9PEZI|nr:putative f0-atpase subunit k protein [Erysiphe neolycopersici]
MVQMYTIAGRQIGSHVLAMVTLGTMFSSLAYFTSGGSKTKKLAQGPPINASSVEEESFIKDFLKSAEKR